MLNHYNVKSGLIKLTLKKKKDSPQLRENVLKKFSSFNFVPSRNSNSRGSEWRTARITQVDPGHLPESWFNESPRSAVLLFFLTPDKLFGALVFSNKLLNGQRRERAQLLQSDNRDVLDTCTQTKRILRNLEMILADHLIDEKNLEHQNKIIH